MVERADLVIPMATIEEVNNRLANTLVGYFIGKRLAFPIVENYVKNTLAVWVKLHDVQIAAFTENGTSMIATKLGKPVMLDTYTSTMCSESRGRNSYARALIEVTSD